MMKKIFAALAALTMIACAGCSDKKESASSESVPATTGGIVQDVPPEETQPDPLEPKPSTDATEATAAEAETTSAESTAEPVSEESDESGESPAEESAASPENLSDEELVSMAQTLFESACRTSWDFHVGCPYTLDYNSTAENSLGWKFYLVTSEGISSIADVEADYYSTFSDTYTTDLSEIYLESGGRVYALDGQRGSNIYYTGSAVTAVTSRQENEVFFTVENYYSGSDFSGEGAYTQTAEFSAVLHEDGSWRAGVFTLPY
ncbi:MAG: hypothetical protein IJX77_00920 [Ruminococcus sp.]|nr:hypothetical protein [Ruminococcus sp.]